MIILLAFFMIHAFLVPTSNCNVLSRHQNDLTEYSPDIIIQATNRFQYPDKNIQQLRDTPVIKTDKDAVDTGQYSVVCWSIIFTTTTNLYGKVLNHGKKYVLSFENPGNTIKDESNDYKQRRLNFYAPIITERKVGNNVEKEIKYTRCNSGIPFGRLLEEYAKNKKQIANKSDLLSLNADVVDRNSDLIKDLIVGHIANTDDCQNVKTLENSDNSLQSNSDSFSLGNIVKCVDDKGKLHCYYEAGISLEHVSCPSDTSQIPYLDLVDGKSIVAQYIDSKNNVHCCNLTHYVVFEIQCPVDISSLPYVNLEDDHYPPNPWQKQEKIVKFVDDNNVIHCYFETNQRLEKLDCPMDTSSIPLVDLSTGTPITVKYVNPQNELHCYDLSLNSVMEKQCPIDVSNLPYIDIENDRFSPNLSQELKNIVKFIDDNNVTHCYFMNNQNLKKTICPYSTHDIPHVDLSNNKPVLVKYIDPENYMHCYDLSQHSVSEKKCPIDTSNLPYVNLEYDRYPPNHWQKSKELSKFVDDNNVVFCYFETDRKLENSICPFDISEIPFVDLSAGLFITVKSMNSRNKLLCYDLYSNSVIKKQCPKDIYNLPYIDLDKRGFSKKPQPKETNMVKFVDDNNIIHCYLETNNILEETICPARTNDIPYADLKNGETISVKYMDPQNNLHCYDLSRYFVKERQCPTDTSNLPYVNLRDEHYPPNPWQKSKELFYFVDNNHFTFCYLKTDGKLETTKCPFDISKIPPVDLSTGLSITVKFLNAKQELLCYDMYSNSVVEKQCPKDVSNLPYIDLDKKGFSKKPLPKKTNMVIFVDDNNVIHCYLETNYILEETNCPARTNDIPYADLKNGETISVKYMDPQNNLHCYDLSRYFIKEKQCPTDTSKLPYVNLKDEHYPLNPWQKSKELFYFVDNNHFTFCYFKTDGKLETTKCPFDISKIPSVDLSTGLFITVKSMNSKNELLCYDMYSNSVVEKQCPKDISNLPYIDLDKKGFSKKPLPKKTNIVKFVDDNNVIHCYLETNYILEETNCPVRTNDIPYADLKNGETISVKYMDPQNNLHCYDLSRYFINEKQCPTDISDLPYVNLRDEHYPPNPWQNQKKLLKLVDDDNVVHCYSQSKEKLKMRNCPLDTSTISPVDLTTGSSILIKYIDPQNKIHCYDLTSNSVTEKLCPIDVPNLPYIDIEKHKLSPNPWQKQENVFKFVDNDNVIHCYSKSSQKLEQINCPAGTNRIPYVDLSKGKTIQVKYKDPENYLHCYDMSQKSVIEKQCPFDTSRLPNVNIKNYLVESSSMENPTKFVDYNGHIHCYINIKKKFKKVNCPSDTSKLLDVDLSNGRTILVENIDLEGHSHCYDLSQHSFTEKQCPFDTSNLPYVNVKDKQYLQNIWQIFGKNTPDLLNSDFYLAKHTDTNGDEKCFKVYLDFLQNSECPFNTDNLPTAPVDELEYIGKVGSSLTGFKCLLVNGEAPHFIECPEDVDILPNISHNSNFKPIPMMFSGDDTNDISKLICESNLM